MTERPILFAGSMVRAILGGRKTQTRRVVDERMRVGYPHDEVQRAWRTGFITTGGLSFNWNCPYGRPGDRLWVRETWRAETSGEVRSVYYRADEEWHEDAGWKPSIHMPRWASRLTLDVTGVRVQRLQEISEEDARAEGVEPEGRDGHGPLTHTNAFRSLWVNINGARPGCSWEANPWVWVVSFSLQSRVVEDLP